MQVLHKCFMLNSIWPKHNRTTIIGQIGSSPALDTEGRAAAGYNGGVPSHQSATAAKGAGSHAFRRGQSLTLSLIYLADQRSWAVLAGLAAAILLPEITLSSRLPAVRLEQLLFPYALLVFWADRFRRRPYHVAFLDWIFLGLGASTLVSILAAPLILRTRLSPRDFYELAKIALYYGFYRLARDSCAQSLDQARIQGVFLAAGTAGAVFSIAQYFDWLGVNAWLTPFFAPEPHLGVLRQSGRVVGTIGNPNYLGIICVMLATAALLTWWLRDGKAIAPLLDYPRGRPCLSWTRDERLTHCSARARLRSGSAHALRGTVEASRSDTPASRRR